MSVTLPGRGYRFRAQVRTVGLDGEYMLIASRTRSQLLLEQAENEPDTAAKDLRAMGKSGNWWRYSVPLAAFVALIRVSKQSGLAAQQSRRL